MNDSTRREFLRLTTTAAALPILPAFAWSQAGKGPAGKKGEGEIEAAPAEDLMREHGLLNRVLLIYQEYENRLGAGMQAPPEVLASAATIIRDFIEGYHEKLEEDYLFPRFEKAQKLTDLVAVLRTQHAAGRQVTQRILASANAGAFRAAGEREKLIADLAAFIRMYRPHEAREDTVLFPALHQIVSKQEYEELGDKFEDIEHQKFGKEGFEGMVVKVGDLEKQLGIYDLAQFTPK